MAEIKITVKDERSSSRLRSRLDEPYKIVEVINSTAWEIGESLTVREVDRLIAGDIQVMIIGGGK